MPEPFSIATGAFGLMTGSIALLLTSLERLNTSTHKFKECKQRLTQSQLHLEFSKRKLNDWIQKWTVDGKYHPESTYVFLWGEHGWRSLQHRINCIVDEIEHAQRILLTGRSSASELSPFSHKSEESTWKVAIRRFAVDRSSDAPEADVHIGRKIAFAVYRSTDLNERIDRIKKLVDDIEADSRLIAADVVRRYGDKPPSCREDMVQNVFTRTRPLWLDLGDAHQELSEGRGTFALIFRPPLSNDLWRTKEEQPLQIDLLHTDDSFAASTEGHWVSASYSFHDRQNMGLADEIQSRLALIREDDEKATLEKTLRTTFKDASALSAIDLQRFNKRSDLGRLRAAVAIATWVIYAWPTAWVRCICSCGIRYASLASGERFPVFRAVINHEDQACPGCSTLQTETEQYMLLGALLTEIALACPVQVSRNAQSEWEFELFESNGMGSGSARRYDMISLLRLLDYAQLRPYQTAVAHCFKPKPSRRHQSHLCAEDVWAYMTNVVNPYVLSEADDNAELT